MNSKCSNINGLVFPLDGFLVGFDVYDREEMLDPELNRYDPNKLEDLKEHFDKYYFGAGDDLSKEIKVQAFQALADALKDSEYDFASLLCNQADFNSISLPSSSKDMADLNTKVGKPNNLWYIFKSNDEKAFERAKQVYEFKKK